MLLASSLLPPQSLLCLDGVFRSLVHMLLSDRIFIKSNFYFLFVYDLFFFTNDFYSYPCVSL